MALPSCAFLSALLITTISILLVAPIDPEVSYEFVRNTTATPQETDADFSNHLYTRSTTYLTSHGERLHTWLYLPKQVSSEPPPVVILAQGLGAQKDLGVHKYANRFASAGMAVVTFDYRTFGGSDGEPRNWASPYRHLEDWWAVVQHVQETGLDGKVNPKKMALWGSSYSGGHVLVTAAKLKENVTAVVAQVPHLQGTEAITNKLRTQGLLLPLRTIWAGLQDIVRSSIGLSPVYISTVGLPGQLALMHMTPAGLDAYYARHPKVYMGGWQPKVRARLSVVHGSYSPVKVVPNITAPVLFVGGTQDTICPPAIIQAAQKLLPGSEYYEVDASHFAIYSGEPLEKIMTKMTEFFVSKLEPVRPEVGEAAPS